MKQWLGVVGMCITMVACGESSTAPRDVTRDSERLFQTDSLEYAVRIAGDEVSADVGVTFTNRTGAAVYITNCGGATAHRLERWNGSRWETMWSPALPACLSPPIVVANGSTWRTMVWVRGGVPGSNVAPRFTTTRLSGEYRVVWTSMSSDYNAESGSGTRVAESQTTSNRFVLVTR